MLVRKKVLAKMADVINVSKYRNILLEAHELKSGVSLNLHVYLKWFLEGLRDEGKFKYLPSYIELEGVLSGALT